jgi:maltoporin
MTTTLATASRHLLVGALFGASALSPAFAVEWGGYFRGGPGSTHANASRACYTLPGAGGKFRLGNECDFYGEFKLSQAMNRDGVEYSATLMTNLYNPGTDTGSSKLGINQMYVQAKGLDVLPGSTFWVGKRFYDRTEVYIIDTKFTQQDGVGAGVTDIKIGSAKLALAYFHDDGQPGQPGDRMSVDVSDIAVNEGGAFRVHGGVTKGRFPGGTSGSALTLLHEQKALFGVQGMSNALWLQASRGSADLNTGFGNLMAGSANKGLRIADSITWQSGSLGGQVVALHEQTKDSAGLKTTQTAFGGRLAYAFTRNFKLLGELGTTSRKVDDNPSARVTKFTIAPTLSTGPGLFDRPELRLYVTHGQWNKAAGNVTGQASLAGKTSGTSVGAQVEMWF